MDKQTSAIVDSDDEGLAGPSAGVPTPAPGPFNKAHRGSNGSRATKRRESLSNVDSIHEQLLPSDIMPAQLYATESGHLYHAGKMCIVLVGLPARGKTHHAVALTRYLRWLGVRTHAFHLGDYRRKICGQNFKAPADYFQPQPSPETVKLRQSVFDACLSDLFGFLDEGGQVAIYDAVNPTAAIRRNLKAKFEERNIGVLFVECISTDDSLVARNVRDVKLTSPDFQGQNYRDAVRNYLKRIELHIPHYDTMQEPELSYIKLINVNERVFLNRAPLGYLQNRVVFFLMNTHLKSGCVYFARGGFAEKNAELFYRNDEPLSEAGTEYAIKLRETLLAHIEERHAKLQTGRSTANTTQPVTPSEPSGIDSKEPEIPEEAPAEPLVSAELIESQLANVKAKQSGAKGLLSEYTTPTPTTSSAWTTGVHDETRPPLVVWSSKRVRTFQTANYIVEGAQAAGGQVTQRTQLTQRNPGDLMDGLSEAQIEKLYPEEYSEHQYNAYHHRYPRAESYHDLAVRMEPLIMEMERTRGDLVVVAHESVLRVLYGYLMACRVSDIPFLSFPKDEIVEIVPNAYYNIANRIPIAGVEPE